MEQAGGKKGEMLFKKKLKFYKKNKINYNQRTFF